MKTIVLGATLAAIVGAMSLSAQAADGTITITGVVTESTCAISPVTGGGDVNVDVGGHGVGSLKAPNSYTAEKALTFKIVGGGTCEIGAASISFGGVNVDATTGNLKNTIATGGSNVQAQLLNDEYEPIDLRSKVPVNIQTGDTDLKWHARLFAKEAATAGDFQSSVLVHIEQE
jgi:major type 1 subunit fimbrin (pilin)